MPDSVRKERIRSPGVVIVAVILVAILIVGAVAWLAVTIVNNRSEYTKHSPISIVGNEGFIHANGVVGGTGTASDPYIIADWEVTAHLASAIVGISITDTDAHFIVRNCYVHGGSTNWIGIYLSNCANGILENNNCSDGLNGMTLDTSNYNITLVKNTCSSNSHDGITVGSGNHNALINNICSSDGNDGISIDRSNNNTLINNNCSGSINGIDLFLSRNNTLVNNNCSNNHNGILLDFSYGNTVADNNCSSNNQYGIILDAGSNYNVIRNSNCSNDLAGIYLDGSNYNVLSNNNCSNNQYGMYLYSSFDNTLSSNTCSLNLLSGIYLGILGPHLSSDNNEIFRNLVFNNAAYGVDISCGSNNRVWNNTFNGNNGATSTFDSSHTQVCDNGTNNWWNSTEGYGNCWSDWTTPDANHNGIVDLPYNILGTASSKDYYPLSAP